MLNFPFYIEANYWLLALLPFKIKYNKLYQVIFIHAFQLNWPAPSTVQGSHQTRDATG
jgi:hypothetical protein